MAIRSKPSWDMDIREINARADQLKRVDAYFKAEQQKARAEAAARARVETEVDDEIARIMSARADSKKNGLRMVETLDDANRPHRTFELEGGATKRDTWMAPYCGEAFQMLRICKTPPTPAEAAAFEDRWRATQAMIASGNIQLPELG